MADVAGEQLGCRVGDRQQDTVVSGEDGGAEAAEPIWSRFVGGAAPMLDGAEPSRPARLVEHWVDPVSGLRLKRARPGAERYWFKPGARPPRRRLWRRESPLEPVD